MGFITNQWLLADPERNRGHDPISTSFRAMMSSDSWSNHNAVAAEVRAIRSNNDFQIIYLTSSDLGEILPKLTQAAAVTTRKKIAFDFLQGLSDAELLAFFADLLPTRTDVLEVHSRTE